MPIAITLDLLVAAAFAIFSLYFGLLGTGLSLPVVGSFNVLVARDPTGSGPALGPYFWVMHTTFLPTAAYLLVILLYYLGKLVVLPVSSVLARGAIKQEPHRLTSLTLAFAAALFGAVAAVIEPFQNEVGKL